MSASCATRELDELMASLSDFKVCVCVLRLSSYYLMKNPLVDTFLILYLFSNLIISL